MARSYHDQLTELFDEWRVGRSGFSEDGIVNYAAYQSAGLKILYLLKETNVEDGDGIDLVDFLRGDVIKRKATWNNVARWTKGILFGRPLPWRDLEHIEPEKLGLLAQIAVLNVKKSSGGHTASWKEVKAAAVADTDYVKRQVELIDPDLIISCGSVVTSFVNEQLVDSDWTRTTFNGIKCNHALGKPHIAYLHPNARVWDEVLYYGLINAVRELISEGVIKSIGKQPGVKHSL